MRFIKLIYDYFYRDTANSGCSSESRINETRIIFILALNAFESCIYRQSLAFVEAAYFLYNYFLLIT